MNLGEEQINIVYNRLGEYKFSEIEILDEIADHICSLIEKEMSDGSIPFEEALEKVISSFPNLQKINQEIDNQVFGKYLRFRNYLIVCIGFATLSFILQITHLPFVTITLAISILLALYAASRLGFLMIKEQSFKRYRKIATVLIMLVLTTSYFVTETVIKLHFQVIVLFLLLYQILALFHFTNKATNKSKLLSIISFVNLCFVLFDYLELIKILHFNLMNLYVIIIIFQTLLFLPIIIYNKLKNNLIIITNIILMVLYSIQSLLILLKM